MNFNVQVFFCYLRDIFMILVSFIVALNLNLFSFSHDSTVRRWWIFS